MHFSAKFIDILMFSYSSPPISMTNRPIPEILREMMYHFSTKILSDKSLIMYQITCFIMLTAKCRNTRKPKALLSCKAGAENEGKEDLNAYLCIVTITIIAFTVPVTFAFLSSAVSVIMSMSLCQ